MQFIQMISLFALAAVPALAAAMPGDAEGVSLPIPRVRPNIDLDH